MAEGADEGAWLARAHCPTRARLTAPATRPPGRPLLFGDPYFVVAIPASTSLAACASSDMPGVPPIKHFVLRTASARRNYGSTLPCVVVSRLCSLMFYGPLGFHCRISSLFRAPGLTAWPVVLSAGRFDSNPQEPHKTATKSVE